MTVSRIMGPSDCSFKKYIEIYLIYCVVLASGVQQNDYCVYVYVFYSTVHCRFLQELKLKLQYIGHLMRRADFLKKIYWHIVDLQCYVSFCSTAKWIDYTYICIGVSLVSQTVKNLPADPGSIPRLGRSPGERNGYPFLCSCLENSMMRGAWCTTVHGVAESDTTN